MSTEGTSFDIKTYESFIKGKSFEELKEEKLTLGKLISDTATRIQDVSGGDDKDFEILENHVAVLKELKAKLSIVIRQMQNKREN